MTDNIVATSAASEDSPRVAVVVGSTGPTRICLGIARWVLQAAQAESPLRYELVDLAEVNLPFLDEPLKAALGQYQHEHTRDWSDLVSSYDGFLFVSPQYNWGYPAPLKNALDFLYSEWSGKAATCVTYGTRRRSQSGVAAPWSPRRPPYATARRPRRSDHRRG